MPTSSPQNNPPLCFFARCAYALCHCRRRQRPSAMPAKVSPRLDGTWNSREERTKFSSVYPGPNEVIRRRLHGASVHDYTGDGPTVLIRLGGPFHHAGTKGAVSQPIGGPLFSSRHNRWVAAPSHAPRYSNVSFGTPASNTWN